MTPMQFQKAARHAVRLKIAVSGPSGSGKTLGALALARALVGPSGRIALIDTENGSASLYGDKFEFDVLNLEPPFTSARYLEAMRAAEEAGYAVLVIDSLSHQWNGEGGILSRKEELDKRPGSNSYTNWAHFTKEHTAFVSSILHLPVHVIATLRAKQDYVVEQNDRGKATPRKVGMAPVQREGLEYEFSVVFDVQMDHKAASSKDRTGLFADKLVDLTDKKVGKVLTDWLASGAPIATTVTTTAPHAASSSPSAPSVASARALEGEQRARPTVSATPSAGATPGGSPESRTGTGSSTERDLAWAAALPLMGRADSWQHEGKGHGGVPLGEIPDSLLKQARHFFKDKLTEKASPRMAEQLVAIDIVMADREANSEQETLPLATASGASAP